MELLSKICAVAFAILTIVITIIVALQNAAALTKILSLLTMLFINVLSIGGVIYVFKKK